jgi:proteasome lid subunit RPN8/RPN11
MRLFILLIFILFAGFSASAQRPVYASDFGMTDENGETLFLYEDLLDQGKTVVLVFFSVSCESCWLSVPDINQWYLNYGENQEDVYVWAIEVAEFSDYDDVNEFETTYGTEYQCWNTNAEDSVLNLFSIAYTPNYFVICPDGSYRNYPIEVVHNAIDACIALDIETEMSENIDIIINQQQLQFSAPDNLIFYLDIYSLEGRLIKSQRISSGETFNLNLLKGIYLYRLRQNNIDYFSTGRIVLN